MQIIKGLSILMLATYVVACNSDAFRFSGLFKITSTEAEIFVPYQVDFEAEKKIEDIEIDVSVEGVAIEPSPCTLVRRMGKQAGVSCTFQRAGAYEMEAHVKFTDGTVRSERASGNVIDPNQPLPQKPRVVVEVFNNNASGASPIAVFSSTPGQSYGTASVKQGGTLYFKHQSTGAAVGVSIEAYEWDTLTGIYTSTGAQFSFTAPAGMAVGEKTARVRITDSQGLSSEIKFPIVVSCSEALAASLAIDETKIQISPAAEHNRFIYNVNGAVSGGLAPYVYMWDYNSDGILDPRHSKVPNQSQRWTSETSVEQYSLYSSDPAGTREFSLRVMDSCFNSVVKKFNRKMAIPSNETVRNTLPNGVPGTLQGPAIPNYYFLHGNLSGLNGNNDKRANVDYIATSPAAAPVPKEVICDYVKSEGSPYGVFTIKGMTHYDPNAQSQGRNHGMELSIKDVYDPFEGNAVPVASRKAPAMHQLSYQTDGAPDGIMSDAYLTGDSTPASACAVDVQMQTGEIESKCANGTPFLRKFIIFDATFSCPELSNPYGKKLKVDKGALYCEWSFPDGCIGGGGGGGGGQPPTPG